jgi:hypothetical protein
LERQNLGGDVGDSAKEEQDAKHISGCPLFKRCDRDGECQAVVEEAQGEENEEQWELDPGNNGPENSHDWVNLPEFILEPVYARIAIDPSNPLTREETSTCPPIISLSEGWTRGSAVQVHR